MANIVPLARIVQIHLMRMRFPDAGFFFLKSAPIAQQTYLVFAMLGIFSDGSQRCGIDAQQPSRPSRLPSCNLYSQITTPMPTVMRPHRH